MYVSFHDLKNMVVSHGFGGCNHLRNRRIIRQLKPRLCVQQCQNRQQAMCVTYSRQSQGVARPPGRVVGRCCVGSAHADSLLTHAFVSRVPLPPACVAVAVSGHTHGQVVAATEDGVPLLLRLPVRAAPRVRAPPVRPPHRRGTAERCDGGRLWRQQRTMCRHRRCCMGTMLRNRLKTPVMFRPLPPGCSSIMQPLLVFFQSAARECKNNF